VQQCKKEEKMKRGHDEMEERLAEREEEVRLLRAAVGETAVRCNPTLLAQRTAMLDPAVNHNFAGVRDRLRECAGRVRALQEQLDGAEFNPHAATGRRLVARVAALQRENEELGREVAEGNVRALEAKVAAQARAIELLRAAWAETADIVR
jgi:hypothetical protein